MDSLESTLEVVKDSEAKFASVKVGESYAHTGNSLTTSSRGLVECHSRLRVTRMQSSLNELLDILQPIEQSLNNFKDCIQDMEKRLSKLWFRRSTKRHDVEAAMSSIFLARNMIFLIRVVQGRGHEEKMLIDSAR